MGLAGNYKHLGANNLLLSEYVYVRVDFFTISNEHISRNVMALKTKGINERKTKSSVFRVLTTGDGQLCSVMLVECFIKRRCQLLKLYSTEDR